MIICYSLAIIFIAFALTLLFIDNIRKAIHGFIIGLIPTLVGSVLLIVSILLILNFVKKIKPSKMDDFTQYLHFTYHIRWNFVIWV